MSMSRLLPIVSSANQSRRRRSPLETQPAPWGNTASSIIPKAPSITRYLDTHTTPMARSNLRHGLNTGHPTTPIPKAAKPSHRKGIKTERNGFVRSVIREVTGFSPYERRVMELLRNSKDKRARKLTKKRLGTLLRSKRKIEELSAIIQEQRRTAH